MLTNRYGTTRPESLSATMRLFQLLSAQMQTSYSMQAKKGDAVVWEALLRDNKNMLRMLTDKDLGEAFAINS